MPIARWTMVWLVLLGTLASARPAEAQTASIVVREILPTPKPGQSGVKMKWWEIKDLAADGATVVGSILHANSYETAFIWRPLHGGYKVHHPQDGLGLPVLTDGDGSRLAYMFAPSYSKGAVTIRERIGGAVVFSHPVDFVGSRSLFAISDEGEAVLERGSQTSKFGYTKWVTRWTSDGPESVGYMPPGSTEPVTDVAGVAASADLSDIVVSSDASSPAEYLVLQSPTQYRSLGTSAIVHGMSGDGIVAVGGTNQGWNSKPVVWRGSNPPVFIALPAPAQSGTFADASCDGEVAVGTYTHKVYGGTRPMIWIKPRGNRDLGMVLRDKFGVEPPAGVALRTADAVSSDGTRIAGKAIGTGVNQGKVYVYLATLPQSEVCYCNCDGSTGTNYLTAADVACFQQRLAQKQFYTNCDNSIDAGGKATYDAADLQCFLDRFQAGCPE